MQFIDALNLSAVTFVPNLSDMGWAGLGPEFDRSAGHASGYEAISPMGEVRPFATEHSARLWVASECKSYVNYANSYNL